MRMALEEDYDYVFLVNQDAWIEANTVGTLVGLAEKYPDYGVLSPVHLDGKGEHLDGSFAKYVGGASAVSSKKSDIVEAAFVNAAFWFIPVPALKKVGGFSPLFFHYGEDVDYIRRMRFYGYRVGYTPLTSGCHDRKNRPITRQIQMKLDRVYYLSVVSDLNSGMAKCLWGGVLAPLKPGVLALLRGRFFIQAQVSGFCVDTLLLQKSSDFANMEGLCFWKMFIQELNRYGVSPDCFIRL